MKVFAVFLSLEGTVGVLVDNVNYLVNHGYHVVVMQFHY